MRLQPVSAHGDGAAQDHYLRPAEGQGFVKLTPGIQPDDATKTVLPDYGRKHIAKHAMPYDIQFKEDMPKTLVGKVTYPKLEEEVLAKHACAPNIHFARKPCICKGLRVLFRPFPGCS